MKRRARLARFGSCHFIGKFNVMLMHSHTPKKAIAAVVLHLRVEDAEMRNNNSHLIFLMNWAIIYRQAIKILLSIIYLLVFPSPTASDHINWTIYFRFAHFQLFKLCLSNRLFGFLSAVRFCHCFLLFTI